MSAAILESAPAGTEFELTRVVDAPRATVWAAFTQEEKLKHWWGPKGFTMENSKMDMRPGGTFHFLLKSGEGTEMWAIWHIREVQPPKRLVFVNSFSDPDANITRHLWSQEWPLEMLTTFEFEEDGGKTILKLHSIPINATAEEHQVFKEGHASMTGGFGATFNALEEFLKQA